jgi:hypothetical protein
MYFKRYHVLQSTEHTTASCYRNTDRIRKIYQYNKTIDITNLNFYCLGMVGIEIWYRNKRYFVITDILITRVYCIYSLFHHTQGQSHSNRFGSDTIFPAHVFTFTL